MKTALILVGCLLIVALSDLAQAKTLVEVEKREVDLEGQGMKEFVVDGKLEKQILDAVHQLVVRVTGDEAEAPMDFSKMFNQMKRLTEMIQIIKTRDLHAGIELLRTVLMEFFFPKN